MPWSVSNGLSAARLFFPCFNTRAEVVAEGTLRRNLSLPTPRDAADAHSLANP